MGLRPGAVVRGYIQVGLTEGTNWNRTAQIKGLEKSLFFTEFSAAMRFHVYLCNIFSAKLGKAQATQASAEHMSSCFVKDVKRKKKKYKITILETFFFFVVVDNLPLFGHSVNNVPRDTVFEDVPLLPPLLFCSSQKATSSPSIFLGL